MTNSKDFSVAVVGGGIGGLTLAIGLYEAGVKVTIFESAPQFAEIGAGIAIGPNAQNALKALGLYEDFLKFADFPDRNLFFEWRMGETPDETFLSETTCKQYGMASIHRAELLETFVKKVPKEICQFGKRVRQIVPLDGKEQVELHFEDGTTHTTDLVIGCDGIHSRVRGALDANKAGPSAVSGSDNLQWSGTWAYRGLIPRGKFVEAVGEKGEFYAKTAQMFLAKNSHILIFPIQGGKTVNLVAFRTDRSHWPERTKFPKGQPWIQETEKQALMDDFSDYSPNVRRMLECIEKPSKWALHQIIPPLQSYVNGRVLVTGDAAHGGTPHQGAMAGQAIEDALFVTRLLSNPAVNNANLTKALGAVDAIRVPRANFVMESSLEAGDTYEFMGQFQDDPAKLGKHLSERFDVVWDYDHDDEHRRLQQWIDQHL
ncbi:FAD/NAD(P)-binding domain-containing protein [Testicularia cyperi]|uniref:FAD/NAD(P)-binding domain-containing protein n=1 Tax=Testicularia cyperi TaxID=1882483 RepID=A0A317XNG9_9BASI|nr:FAD/NAD(P)-binding domain-containing protein [Testicularia cyperi]